MGGFEGNYTKSLWELGEPEPAIEWETGDPEYICDPKTKEERPVMEVPIYSVDDLGTRTIAVVPDEFENYLDNARLMRTAPELLQTLLSLLPAFLGKDICHGCTSKGCQKGTDPTIENCILAKTEAVISRAIG